MAFVVAVFAVADAGRGLAFDDAAIEFSSTGTRIIEAHFEPDLTMRPREAPAGDRGSPREEEPIDRFISAVQVGGDDLIDAAFVVWDPDPGSERWADFSREDRSAALADLVNARQLRNQMAADDLLRLGALRAVALSTTPLVLATLTRQQALHALSLPWVVDATVDAGRFTNQSAYTGTELRSSTRANWMLAEGWDADTGGQFPGPTEPVYIAFVEASHDASGNLNTLPNHVGYKDSASSGSRVLSRWHCFTTGCFNSPALAGTSSSPTHANWVVSTAAGSIEQAQDPAVTSSAERVSRSGIAREAEIVLIAADSASASGQTLALALDKAIERGVDIVNMSVGFETENNRCSGNTNVQGINEVIAAGTAIGILFVGGAGNQGVEAGCNIGYPGTRTEVLAVGALDSDQFGLGTPSYATTLLAPVSPRGGIPISVGGTSRTHVGVGLVAPGTRERAFQGTNQYSGNIGPAVSFSTPVVAGAAAIWRDFLVENSAQVGASGLKFNARTLKVNLLAMADGMNEAGGTSSTGFGPRTGAGRLYLDYPGSFNQTYYNTEYTWVTGRSFISATGSLSVPISVTGMHWVRAALLWEEPGSYGTAPAADVTLHLQKGCSSATYFASDTSYSFSKRARGYVFGESCVSLVATAHVMPAAGRWVYYTIYGHSGNSP